MSDYGWQVPPFTALLVYVARPARTCGLHGDDTTGGRCTNCDELADDR